MSYDIYHDVDISSSPAKVFRAVTEPKHLINWWPLTCEGVPKLGSTYNLFFGEEYNWFGEVIRFTEDKSFHIKMTDSDEDWQTTSFGFELENINGKTRVKFQHVGWPSCNDHFRKSSFCWALLLQGLKNYVEKDIVIPFENRA